MPVTFAARLIVVALAGICFSTSVAEAARIDAKKGRRYRVTKKHGPWMIKVASFHKPPIDRRGKGLSPAEAADALVFELRRKGIPAYAFSKKGQYGRVDTQDRVGRMRKSFSAYRGGVTVLAGNYAGIDDALARKTLEYIKTFQPKFLGDVQASNTNARTRTKLRSYNSGALFRSTPGRPLPLSGAHLTPNPLLTRSEVKSHGKDPLILKLNAGSKISLLKNPGKYSVIVATFKGKSMTALNSRSFQNKFASFKVGTTLDKAGKDAWELANRMRNERNVKAWVFHDRHESVVTIGSFNSPKDTGIARLIKDYGKYIKIDPRTGRKIDSVQMFTIPRNPRPGQSFEVKWIFDPTPRVMEVPQYGR